MFFYLLHKSLSHLSITGKKIEKRSGSATSHSGGQKHTRAANKQTYQQTNHTTNLDDHITSLPEVIISMTIHEGVVKAQPALFSPTKPDYVYNMRSTVWHCFIDEAGEPTVGVKKWFKLLNCI